MSDRLPPDGLDPLLSAATDGYYVVQKDGARFREWFRLVAGPNVVLTPSIGAHELMISAAASGTQGEGKDRRWAPSITDTVIDEFRDSSLGGAWTRVDAVGGTGRLIWTEDADVLSASIIGGDTGGELHAMMIPLAGFGGTVNVGDYFYTHLRHIRSGNFLGGGIILADGITYGAGNQIAANLLNDSTVQARAFTNYSTAGTVGTSGAAILGSVTFLRLILTAANTWRADFSPDGVTWRNAGTVAKTLTPTHVGVYGTSFGTATSGVVPFEMLRRGV